MPFHRGEKVTTFFINAIYGMTGGQMAPTTLRQRATTAINGRTKESNGSPLRMCELLATIDGAFVERGAHLRQRAKSKSHESF